MILRICLIALMLLLIASTVVWSNNILFYVLSDRNESGGWYTDPKDVASLTDPVEAAGHSVKVEDETTVKDLTSAILSKYDHIWILEGDEDTTVEVSKDESDISVIWQYPSNSGKKDAIAILDKKGYVVFESGWSLGFAYRPEAAGDGNIQFALNIAEIKPRLGVMSTDKNLTSTWGQIKKMSEQ